MYLCCLENLIISHVHVQDFFMTSSNMSDLQQIILMLLSIGLGLYNVENSPVGLIQWQELVYKYELRVTNCTFKKIAIMQAHCSYQYDKRLI